MTTGTIGVKEIKVIKRYKNKKFVVMLNGEFYEENGKLVEFDNFIFEESGNSEQTNNSSEAIVSLDDNVKLKLAEVIELWADKNLIDKPTILANAIFFNLEKAMLKSINEINSKFKG